MNKFTTRLASAALGIALVAAFGCIAVGAQSNYAKAETSTYSGTRADIPNGYETNGTAGTFSVTVVNQNDLTIGYAGVNTTAKSGSTYSYAMFVQNYGVMYANNEITGYYPSSVSFTFTSQSSTSGKVLASFSSERSASRKTGTTSVTQNGTYTVTNDDPTLTYWNFSTSNKNVQVKSWEIVYTKKAITTHDITINAPKTTINVGESILLEATCSLEDDIIFVGSDDSIATVSDGGDITGVAPGKVTVTALCEGNGEASIEIEVVAPVHTITITGPHTVELGKTVQINAVCDKGCDVYFEVDVEGIISIDETGLVTGLAVGSCEITAYCDEGGADWTMTVYEGGSGNNDDYDGYYDSITQAQIDAGGQTLLDALRTLNNSKLTKQVGYNAMGTTIASSKYIYTDYDLDSTYVNSDGITVGSAITGFYSNEYLGPTSKFTREHVWCASRLPGGRDDNSVDGDIHMTRPSGMIANGDRSNYYFSASGASKTSDPGNIEPSYRGDTARIIFYTLLLDSTLSLNDNPETDPSAYTLGNVSELFRWNMEYAPLTREQNRNAGAQYLQGNRNPFIDHPEWITAIWGQLYSACTPLVAQYSNGNYLNISQTNAKITANSVKTITATASDYSAVTWTSNNTSIATVDENGVVHSGSKAGTAIITATATVRGERIQKTCKIVVGEVDAPLFQLVTNVNQLAEGQPVVVCALNSDYAIGQQRTNNRGMAEVTKNDNYITWSGTEVTVFTLGKSGNNWTLFDSKLNGYYQYTGSSNNSKTQAYSNKADLTISVTSSGQATLTLSSYSGRTLQYNDGSSIFSFYTSSQKPICLYTTSQSVIDLTSKNVDGQASDTFTINATPYNLGSNPTVNWSIDNTSVATLSATTGTSNTITLKTLGNATVTVSVTNGNVTKTATIGVSCITDGLGDLPETPLELAIKYANRFLDSFTCDSTGKNAPNFKSGVTWSILANEFRGLDSEVKYYFATSNSYANSAIERCVERYDYIVKKYTASTYQNFMNRTIGNAVGLRVMQYNNGQTLYVTGIVIMLFSFVSLAAVFVTKKKEN